MSFNIGDRVRIVRTPAYYSDGHKKLFLGQEGIVVGIGINDVLLDFGKEIRGFTHGEPPYHYWMENDTIELIFPDDEFDEFDKNEIDVLLNL